MSASSAAVARPTDKGAPSAARLLQLLDPAVPCVTTAEVASATGWPRRMVVRRIDVLRQRGYVIRVHEGCYRLTEAGRRARDAMTPITSGPRGRHTGARKVGADSIAAQVWRCLRAKRAATVPDILAVITTEAKEPARVIRLYLNALQAADYVGRAVKREAGIAPTSNGFVRWLLLRDTGPEAPVLNVTVGELRDPNTHERFLIGDRHAADRVNTKRRSA
ncbi:MAG: type IV toxin-antitoxin system AbiEi family antitoxin domain-containing protein [Alphaproteobacteria bacterium]